MKKHLNSIQTKFIVLTMTVILLTAGVVGGLGVVYAVRANDKSVARTMNAICKEEAARLDRLFLSIEQSVKIVAHNALQRENLVDNLQNEELMEEYLRGMESTLLGTAGSTRGAVAVYLRFNPEIEPADLGIFYSKSEPNGDLQEQDTTDFSRVLSGEENLEWYRETVAAGESVWLEPYYNGRIADQVISYVMPLYQNGTLVGIAGMDILFDDVVQEIKAMQIYDTGYAYLVDRNHDMVFHPLGETVCPIEHDHVQWEEFVSGLDQDEQNESVFTYQYERQKMKMTYCNLKNGMRLIVTAPVGETDQQKEELEINILISAILVSIISILIIVSYTQTIVRPLKELTKASKQVAEGNLNVTLMNQSQDEVGELSNSFQQTVDCLRIYMERMNDLAYTDPLTGVKSRTAYDEEIHKVNNNLKMGFDQFGILMLDINGLKAVNDNYGHEVGNRYIINSCKLICSTFKRSPVFRIGGDEFIVLLIGDDLTSVNQLLEKFERQMEEKASQAKVPEDRVSIAAGLAVFDEKRDRTYQDVFKRADQAMYEKKALMKQDKIKGCSV